MSSQADSARAKRIEGSSRSFGSAPSTTACPAARTARTSSSHIATTRSRPSTSMPSPRAPRSAPATLFPLGSPESIQARSASRSSAPASSSSSASRAMIANAACLPGSVSGPRRIAKKPGAISTRSDASALSAAIIAFTTLRRTSVSTASGSWKTASSCRDHEGAEDAIQRSNISRSSRGKRRAARATIRSSAGFEGSKRRSSSLATRAKSDVPDASSGFA